MAVSQREQALSLLAAANNYGDLAVKLSSLKQAKDILLSADLSLLSAELFPYLVELQSSHEALVRKTLVDAIEEISLKSSEHSPVLMQVLLTLLNDEDTVVARQSIVAGTHIFCKVLDELLLQFHRHGLVERWLEEMWSWMIKFKDAVIQIALEARPVGPRLLAIKFLEICVLLFVPDNDSRVHITEVGRSAQVFNISWLAGGHPILDSVVLQSEANKYLLILLDLLRLANGLPGTITISVINSLATIGRRRLVHYSSVLSTLLDFDPNFIAKGVHNASIQYALRSAFLGFLRCTHPGIMESRDKLFKVLRAMGAGDAAEQVMRQVDKMLRNSERASRASKDEQPSSHMLKRLAPMDQEHIVSNDFASKRSRYGSDSNTGPVIQSDLGHAYTVNGVSTKVSPLDNDLTPVEQMIAMIGALLAEGERGAESLEILISQIHPDLLADIVVTNMKHLPKNPPPLTRFGNFPVTRHTGLPNMSSQVPPTIQNPVLSSNAISTPLPTTVASTGPQADPKRDSRRDPRRLDPRRVASTVGTPLEHIMEDVTSLAQSGLAESEVDPSALFKRQPPPTVVQSVDNTPEAQILTPKAETESHIPEKITEQVLPDERAMQVGADVDFKTVSSAVVDNYVKNDSDAQNSTDIIMTDADYSPSMVEDDQLSPSTVDTPILEETSVVDLPVVPSYVELTEEQQKEMQKLAVKRIVDSCKQVRGTGFTQTRMALLSRLVAQVDAADDDVISMIQKHIVSDYQNQKGHELVMHVLYHLHALMMSDSAENSSLAIVYDKFLLGVAKCLLDSLPANDKSFSRLFCEAPSLPEAAFKLLDDICCSDNNYGKDIRDGDRVHQGLGSLWTLILSRPNNRQPFLDIALKCAVHPKDEIRSKAIRLVANKLYVISFISEKIENFATNKLLSAVNKPVLDAELSVSGVNEQRTEGQMGSQETSISGSQISEPGTSENEPVQSDSQNDSSISPAQAQQYLSLFFALCTKKPSLLQLVFDRYDHAPKGVKQTIHRHVPILIRSLGPSYSDLLKIISDPPQGSENLLTQVLQVLCEGTTPSTDLIATVKRLYETKLKDATIVIPILSFFTKDEVLPIFPRLVQLQLDKFQTALAHILQGSAYMGPALTPAEVLVAIHDINPEKDGVPLKKVMDACSACFEQRTVFTQQVLAKALNQMVDQTPLPLLFMRTVIQAIDAYPKLVDFVMEILSKLVSKQVWRMPKLWVGFLKCISQTQPHSFRVLLQLPSPQLEGALNKYGSLRGPLAAYANQPSIKPSLPRSTLQALGLASEPQLQQQNVAVQGTS